MIDELGVTGLIGFAASRPRPNYRINLVSDWPRPHSPSERTPSASDEGDQTLRIRSFATTTELPDQLGLRLAKAALAIGKDAVRLR